AEAAFSGRDLHYLVDLVAPLAALCLLAPLMLLGALPERAITLLSSATTQTSIHFHYTAGLIPPLVIGAIFGAKRLSRWAFPVAAAVVLAALIGNYRLGPIPGWRHVPGGQTFQATAAHVTAHDRISDRARRRIPTADVVREPNTDVHQLTG